MLKLIQRDLNNPDVIRIEYRSIADANTLCVCPDELNDEEVLDLIDVLENNVVVGKTVEVNQTKLSNKQSASTQFLRDKKLDAVRKIRDEKLHDVDVMVNEIALGLRSDVEDVAAYRSSLLGLTDAYKTNGVANSSLDSLVIENISWPEEP